MPRVMKNSMESIIDQFAPETVKQESSNSSAVDAVMDGDNATPAFAATKKFNGSMPKFIEKQP